MKIAPLGRFFCALTIFCAEVFMKPENFSELGVDSSMKARHILSREEVDKNRGRDVGFRLCPCKVRSPHFHTATGPWCDIPEYFFRCLPEGVGCHDVGLCRFKTEVPGILQRLVSEKEVRFSLRRAVLVQRASHCMGKLHKNLQRECSEHAFPRGIIL